MEAPQLILQVSPQMIAGAEFSQNVQVKENNRIATTDIPRRWRNPATVGMCEFIRAHPLYGAFFHNNIIFPQMINEWWYTCRVAEDQESISGTIDEGSRNITITEEVIRQALDLPTFEEAGEGGFQSKLSKQEARDEAFPMVGQPITTGVIRYSQFTGKWKLLFSFVVRCLGGKVGSTDQLNEFETHLFHSMVTGRRISFSQLYFEEIVSQTIGQKRTYIVPFMRVLSLCLESVLGTLTYNSFENFYVEYPTPQLHPKVFSLHIPENDVPMTPSMLQWIDNPFHVLSGTESDHSDSEGTDVPLQILGGMGQGNEEEGERHPDAVSPPHGGPGMTLKSLNSLQSDRNPCQTEAQNSKAELLVHSETYPMIPHGLLANYTGSSTTHIQALLDQQIPEDDVHVTHSSAMENSINPVLEQVKCSSYQSKPSPNNKNSLESHISTLTLTHVRSIEQDVSLLDIPVPCTGITPFCSQYESIFQTHSEPLPKAIFSSATLVHNIKPDNLLHSTALVVNVPLQSQSGIQTSFSQSDDPLPYKQERREDTYNTSSVPESSQSEVSMIMLLNTIKDMTTQFDNKLGEMQTEIQELKAAYPTRQIEDLKATIKNLSKEVQMLKKDRQSVGEMKKKENLGVKDQVMTESEPSKQKVEVKTAGKGKLIVYTSKSGLTPKNKEERMLEKPNMGLKTASLRSLTLKDAQTEGEQLNLDTQSDTQKMKVGQTQGEKVSNLGEKKRKRKLIFVDEENTEDESDQPPIPDLKLKSDKVQDQQGTSASGGVKRKVKRKLKQRYNPKTERMDEYSTDDTDDLSPPETDSEAEDKMPISQIIKNIKNKETNPTILNEFSQIIDWEEFESETGKDDKTKKTPVKIETELDAESMNIMAREANLMKLSIEEYRVYIQNLHKNFRPNASSYTHAEKDSCDIAAEELHKELEDEEKLALEEELLRKRADEAKLLKIKRETKRMDTIKACYKIQNLPFKIIKLYCTQIG